MTPPSRPSPGGRPGGSAQAWFTLVCGMLAGASLLAAAWLLFKGRENMAAVSGGLAAVLCASAPISRRRT